MRTNNVAVVLAGGMIKDQSGNWHTATYGEKGDIHGLDGHRLRVEAASWLSKDDPELIILASGGKGQFESIPDAPATSLLIKKELLALGVPERSILTEEKSGTTYQQLKALASLVSENGWQKISIISNGWHLPRIEVMINSLPELAVLTSLLKKGGLEFVDADQVLLNKNPGHWAPIIEKVRQSKAYADRLSLEAKGVGQIKNGSYKFR